MEHRGRAHRHPAHALDAGSDDAILRSAHHRLRGELDRLLARSALAVDGDRRRALAQMLGREHRVAPDLHRLLAALADATHDHIVHGLGIDPAALDDGIERSGRKVDGVDTGKASASFSPGGTDGFDDIGF